MSVTRLYEATAGAVAGAAFNAKEVDAVTDVILTGAANVSVENNTGATIVSGDRGIVTIDAKGKRSFFFKPGSGFSSEGDLYIEFNDTDSHKFYVDLNAGGQATDIISELMQAAGDIVMDGFSTASGLVSLTLRIATPDIWVLTTPDGTAVGDPNTTPLNSIAIGAHTWTNVGILNTGTAPTDTALPAAW